MKDVIHNKQDMGISLIIIAIALLALIAWFDGYARKKVKEEIRSENTKRKMSIAINQRTAEEIKNNIEEAKKVDRKYS